MITFSKVRSFVIESGKRILKVSQFGTKTAKQVSSFGDDSAPLNDMTAIFAETSNNAEPVIIGYINTDQLAAIGEKRIFSKQENGDLSAYIWLKNDETIEIHGNSKNMVRYQELETAFNSLKSTVNEHITKYNTHTHSGNGVPTISTQTPSSADITPAKIENIKTN